MFVYVFAWINFPPKLLAEMFCFRAHALEVIEVVRRNALEDFSHARHGEQGKPVMRSGVVEVTLKETHELPALRFF